MSEAKADVDRNPVSPVVTSPDASKHPDESRHVTSPATIFRRLIRWFRAPSNPIERDARLFVELARRTAESDREIRQHSVSPTDGETPPPAR
jgi:hypothetical protein